MPLLRVMKITSLLFLAMTAACNSGSTGRAPGVDADGLFGVVRTTYYHLDSSKQASIIDIPVGATAALSYTFDSKLGLRAEGDISFDSIRLSIDRKSITVVGSAFIYEAKAFIPEQLAADGLGTLQSQIKTICIGSPFSKDTLIGTTGFNEIQFNENGSTQVVNAFDRNGMQQTGSSYLKEETATETIYHVPEMGDFHIRLGEPSAIDSQFFHTVVSPGQWSGVENLYCHENRSPVVVVGAVKETFTTSGSWTAPSGVTSVTVECWGGGGGGADDASKGGGGGAYSMKASIPVIPGDSYPVNVGAGGAGEIFFPSTNGSAGGDSWFSTQGTVLAKGGGSGAEWAGQGGKSDSGVGDIKYSGGNGGGLFLSSGGGGSSAGPASNGVGALGMLGATAPNGGGNGGSGGAFGVNGVGGSSPGGGGGSGGKTASGGAGGAGKVIVSWN